MTYHGQVQNGRVLLDEGAVLPEGAEVEVRVVESPRNDGKTEDVPTLYEQLKPFVGAVSGLPADLAENHDHYLHGRPKK